MPGAEQNGLQFININNVLPFNSAPEKRNSRIEAIETNRACPQIWTQNVSDDEFNGDVATPAAPAPPPEHGEEDPQLDYHGPHTVEMVQRIAHWLRDIQTRGVPPQKLLKHLRPEVNDDEDATWWEEDLVRVFLPYYDIEAKDIKEVEGRVNPKNGDPMGRCTVRLTNGDEITGSFRPDKTLSGMASATGSNMEAHGLLSVSGFHRDGVLHGQGRALLRPRSLWPSIDRQISLEGIFNDSYLEGPVRGLDTSGNLIFVGYFQRGLPTGYCWLAKEGQGWLFGEVDERGRFSGDNIAYIYPDLLTAITGTFENEQLVEARSSKIIAADFDEHTDILKVMLSQHILPDAPAYTRRPSDSKCIPCDWKLEDNYERVTVFSKKSDVHWAGDGLFARRDLPKDTIIAYYNGLHIEPKENYSSPSCDYQIYVDWSNTEGSPYVDIPMECIDLDNYRASLAHKANHSFSPNCKFVAVDHPRFGRIPSLKTLVPIPRYAELFSHYKYDTALAPRWYQEAWQRANCEDEENESDELN